MIRLKRVYDDPSDQDGLRVLVERLWPRGLTKEKAHIDLWAKEIAPSAELRKWFEHDPNKWHEFQERYRAELRENGTPVERLRSKVSKGTVTFVYAAKNEEHNSAIVLKAYIESA